MTEEWEIKQIFSFEIQEISLMSNIEVERYIGS